MARAQQDQGRAFPSGACADIRTHITPSVRDAAFQAFEAYVRVPPVCGRN
jgi:hypothetical protein